MTMDEHHTTLLTMLKNINVEMESLANEAALHRDGLALTCLHKIAYESTSALTNLYLSIPDMLTAAARKSEMWPVLFNRRGVVEKAARQLVELIDVGGKHHSPFTVNNLLAEKSDAREWLYVLLRLIANVRRQLARMRTVQELIRAEANFDPDFLLWISGTPGSDASKDAVYQKLHRYVSSPEVMDVLVKLFDKKDPFEKPGSLRKFIINSVRLPALAPDKRKIKAWIKVIRELMMDVYDGRPEECSLSWIGKYLAEGKKASSPRGTASYNSNVRSGLFARLEKTLMSIARGG
jgi:hypothetical protein